MLADWNSMDDLLDEWDQEEPSPSEALFQPAGKPSLRSTKTQEKERRNGYTEE